MSDPKATDAKASEPKPTAAPAAPSTFDLIDQEDEQQIVDDLRGIPIEKFVYKNARGILELSYAGTKWAIRKMAERGEAIRVQGHPQIQICPMDAEFIVTTVLAERVIVDKESGREIHLDSTVGSSRNWKKQLLRDGSTVIPDPHFLKKSVSIATRNVQQALMPAELKREMIEELKSGRPAKPRQKAAASKPADKRPAAEKKSAAAKPPANPNAADPKTRQRLHILMGKYIKDTAERKKAFKDLTGFATTGEVEKMAFSQLVAAFERMGEGKVNELRKSDKGVYSIFEKPTGNTIFPRAKQQEIPKEASKPTAATGEAPKAPALSGQGAEGASAAAAPVAAPAADDEDLF